MRHHHHRRSAGPTADDSDRRFARGPFGPGRGGPDFDGPGFGRGPRASRGNVRAAVLALLAEQPRHGYEIITEIAERSGGAWRPSPGSVYPTLKHLAHDELISLDHQEGKRVFQLTDSGKAYVQEHADELADPWNIPLEPVDEGVAALRDLTQAIHAAAKQVSRAGTAEQIAAAGEVLAQTRRSLYLILAGEPVAPETASPGTR